MIDVVADGETPVISLASSARIIEPMNAKKAWVFKTPQTDTMMVLAILEHAAKRGMKTMAYIGFNDALGEAFYAEFEKFAEARKIKIVASERFAPRDTSVTAQVLKLRRRQPGHGRDRRLGHARGAAGRRRWSSAATRAASTSTTASPTTISCASAARTSRACSCRPARSSSPPRCRPTTRPRPQALDYVQPLRGG